MRIRLTIISALLTVAGFVIFNRSPIVLEASAPPRSRPMLASSIPLRNQKSAKAISIQAHSIEANPIEATQGPNERENPNSAAETFEEIEFINDEWKRTRDLFYDSVIAPELRAQIHRLREEFELRIEPLSKKVALEDLPADERTRVVEEFQVLQSRYSSQVRKILGEKFFQELIFEEETFNERMQPLLRIPVRVAGVW